MDTALFSKAQLFSPYTLSIFQSQIYETRWEHFNCSDNNLCDLFTSKDLEEYLFASRVWDTDDPWSNAGVLCAKFPYGGSKVEASSFEELLNKFSEGHTIVLQQSQKRWKKIADYCSFLSQVFNARVSANIYITPPTSKGFTAHYDMHDVLLLQTEGTKIWNVKTFDKVPLTIVDDAFENEFPKLSESDCRDATEINLSAGQRLYMPRGTIHQGVAYKDQPSVHITFGIKPITWYDILSLQIFHPKNLQGSLLETVNYKSLSDLGAKDVKHRLMSFIDDISLDNVDEGLMKYLHQRANAIKPSSRFVSLNNIENISLDSTITLCQEYSVSIISDTWVTFGSQKTLIPKEFISRLKKAIKSKQFVLFEISDGHSVNTIDFAKWLIKAGFATFNNKEKK